jgi:hypothetical protein
MNGHLVFNWFFRQVSFWPPQKSQRFTVLFLDVDLMKYLLYVSHHGYSFLTESQQHAN